jgi:hypothetical protein
VVLRFYRDHEPFFAIVVEAKSINKSTSVYDTIDQLNSYFSKGDFLELKEFAGKCLGVTLTKYSNIVTSKTVVSITWSDVISAFFKEKERIQRASSLIIFRSLLTLRVL